MYCIKTASSIFRQVTFCSGTVHRLETNLKKTETTAKNLATIKTCHHTDSACVGRVIIAALANQLLRLKFRNLIFLYIFYHLLMVNMYK